MELPIDHFRLLGITPAAGAEEVLRAFQLRLDRTPADGFTNEVLAQRSELLRLSADLLSDSSQRKSYEVALLEGASGLDLSANREVAGLLLLWESKASYQAFKLARRALQPPQAPALGSGRESDLTLIAALSCRDAAFEEQSNRRYASAADLLQEGIQLLQRMGKLPEERKTLEEDLEALLPYRILDLLSRDLGDEQSHQDGLRLLDNFVLKRGGLEGRKSSDLIGGLNQSDFELFFLQIRKFLTAKEQSDLFVNWYRRGSSEAGFLAALSLIASGFSYRKPAYLQESRKILKSLNIPGFDPMPLLGCIDLLLADVKQAEARFRSSNDERLKTWLNNYPGESLAALCDYCRNWLSKDVLPGFRDINMQTIVDLEAWFAHKEVQEYVEFIESKSSLGISKNGFSFFSPFSSEKSEANDIPRETIESDRKLPMPGGVIDPSEDGKSILLEPNDTNYEDGLKFIRNKINTFSSKFKSIDKSKVSDYFSSRPILASFSVFLGLFLVGTTIGSLTIRRPQIKEPLVETVEKKSSRISTGKKLDKNNLINKKDGLVKKSEFKLLTVDTPTDNDIKLLIASWLNGKSTILRGEESQVLKFVARPSLYKRVLEERKKDLLKERSQIINANIISLDVEQRNKKRISAIVFLKYTDKIISDSGDVISETVIPKLKVKYVLGRDKNTWQLVDYISGG